MMAVHPKTHQPLPTTEDDGTPIVWFNGPQHPLSNLYHCHNCTITTMYNGQPFSSVESAYQSIKAAFHNKPNLAYDIAHQDSSVYCMQLGKSIPVSADWHKIKVPVMEQLLFAKAIYCSCYRHALNENPCSFRERTLHLFWGGIYGRNKLGILHSAILHKVKASLGPILFTEIPALMSALPPLHY